MAVGSRSPARCYLHRSTPILSPSTETFFSVTSNVTDPETGRCRLDVTGFVEKYDERFFAYYTCEASDSAKKRVSRWIQHPDLDATWFSSPLLQSLWDRTSQSVATAFTPSSLSGTRASLRCPAILPPPLRLRGAKTTTVPRRSKTVKSEKTKLSPRAARRDSTWATASGKSVLPECPAKQLRPSSRRVWARLPSRFSHGGHDLYQNGRITNRADTFEDHRNTVRYLYQIYRSVLNFTEECAWQSLTDPERRGGSKVGKKGEPLIIEFGEPISTRTFDRWVSMAFQKRNRFKLWGDPIRLGPAKVHVYGADRHLWQPINLEITSKGVVAILPRGTCGNTFHRLVANIQHYVSPRIQAWIGSEPFESIVSRWPQDSEKPE